MPKSLRFAFDAATVTTLRPHQCVPLRLDPATVQFAATEQLTSMNFSFRRFFKQRKLLTSYDADALITAIARREDPNDEGAAHESTYRLLASLRDASHFATRMRSLGAARGVPPFGVEALSAEEHERREAALARETEDGEERPDLNDLLTVTRA